MRENSATNPSTSTLDDIPRPAEAALDWHDDWQDLQRRPYRFVWSRPLPLDNPWSIPNDGDFADTDVRVVISQFADGTLGAEDDPPEVYLGGESYTPESARKLAAALVAAVELADRWAGVTR